MTCVPALPKIGQLGSFYFETYIRIPGLFTYIYNEGCRGCIELRNVRRAWVAVVYVLCVVVNSVSRTVYVANMD